MPASFSSATFNLDGLLIGEHPVTRAFLRLEQDSSHVQPIPSHERKRVGPLPDGRGSEWAIQ